MKAELRLRDRRTVVRTQLEPQLVKQANYTPDKVALDATQCCRTINGGVGGVACADEAQPAGQQCPRCEQTAIEVVH